MPKKRHGFTVIEVMITLAIIGAAVAVVLMYQSKAESSLRVAGTVSAMTNMTSKIRAYYASVGSYNDITPEKINAMGLVTTPLTWESGTLAMRDAWGNVMNIVGNGPGTTPAFVITIGGVNSLLQPGLPLTAEECVSVATELANGADRVNVGDTSSFTFTNGVVAGGKAYKAAGNILSIANLTDAAGCGAVRPMIVLQYH
jgi:prepilin-type N-terminal cleavage/methylation domain-containing protein